LLITPLCSGRSSFGSTGISEKGWFAVAVSFAADILPLFRTVDIQHMKVPSIGVLLDDYSYMSDPTGSDPGDDPAYPDHAHARLVYCRLTGHCTPRMPPGGPYWSPEQLQRF